MPLAQDKCRLDNNSTVLEEVVRKYENSRAINDHVTPSMKMVYSAEYKSGSYHHSVISVYQNVSIKTRATVNECQGRAV